MRKRKAERVPSARALLDLLEAIQTRSTESPAELSAAEPPTAQPPDGQSISDTLRDQSLRALDPDEDLDDAVEPAVGTTRSGRRRLAVAGLLVAGLVAAAIVALSARSTDAPPARVDARAPGEPPRPARLLAPFPADHAGIVVASQGDAAAGMRDRLCALLSPELPPGGLQCIDDIGDRDVADLRAEAAAAGGALVVHVQSARDARLLPSIRPDSPFLDHPLAAAIAADPPTVLVGTDDARTQVARLALALRQLVSDKENDPIRGAASLPVLSDRAISWRGAALGWLLRNMATGEAGPPLADIRNVMQRCAVATNSAADVYCTAVHLVYTVECETCDDTGQVYAWLTATGHLAFRKTALMGYARWQCERGDDPAGTVISLLAMTETWAPDACRRWTLVGPASCAVVSGGAAARSALDLAFPERKAPALELCPNRGTMAMALADRGKWHYRSGQLQQAETDFSRAWSLDASNPAYLVRWAEAFVRARELRLSDDDKRKLDERLSAPSADEPGMGDGDRAMVAFVRWVGLRTEGEGAALERLYAALPDGAPALARYHDPDGSLAAMACAGGAASVVCRAHEVLVKDKDAGSLARLRELLRGR